jgi:hypothetical protein
MREAVAAQEYAVSEYEVDSSGLTATTDAWKSTQREEKLS